MNINLVMVIFGLALSISVSTLVASGPGSNFQVFAQSGNDTSTASTGILITELNQ